MDKDVQKIEEQIREVGAVLEKTRETIAKHEAAIGKVPGDIKDTEARIIEELGGQFMTRQQAEAIQKQQDEFQTLLDKIKAQLKESGSHTTDPRETLAYRASADYIKNGNDGAVWQEYKRSEDYAADVQKRAINETDLTKGGALVDEFMTTEMTKILTEYSPLRLVARVITLTGSNAIGYRRRTGIPTAYWSGESGGGTESSSTFGDGTIYAHALTVKTQVSSDWLADSVIGGETLVTDEASEAFAVAEGTAFISGSGSQQPFGIVGNATIATVNGNDTTNQLISADDFIDLKAALKLPYQPRASYLFNRTTFGEAMTLKDSQNNYLWQPRLTDAAPNMICGLPYYIMTDIDSYSSGVTGQKPIYCGDFQRGYWIVDRQQVIVIRDPYSSKPDVEFLWRKRVGGDVFTPEAIKILITA